MRAFAGSVSAPGRQSLPAAFSVERSENLCDGLADAIAHLPSDSIGGALIHLVLASDFLNLVASWVEHADTERGQIRLRQTTRAAARCVAFALPVLLSLPQAKAARRLARRYAATGILPSSHERRAS